jgi:chromate transport protein ChrA
LPRATCSFGAQRRLLGLKATVIALIVQALLRIGRRALVHPVHWLLAVAASS